MPKIDKAERREQKKRKEKFGMKVTNKSLLALIYPISIGPKKRKKR